MSQENRDSEVKRLLRLKIQYEHLLHASEDIKFQCLMLKVIEDYERQITILELTPTELKS